MSINAKLISQKIASSLSYLVFSVFFLNRFTIASNTVAGRVKYTMPIKELATKPATTTPNSGLKVKILSMP